MGTVLTRGAVSLGLATTAALTGYLICWIQIKRTNQKRERIENQMRLVGHVTGLFIYPLKSCRPVIVSEAQCGTFGFFDGNAKDRVFVITDEKRRCLTARRENRMVLIQPSYHDDELWLDAPDMVTIKLKIPDPMSKSVSVTFFDQKTRGIDCGDEVSNWLCKMFDKEENALRLFYHPWETNERDPSHDAKGWDLYDVKNDSCIYADLCAFNILNESSLDDLNSRLKTKVSLRNFRPNITMSGSNAFAEDDWKYIKIGSRALFRCIRPCTRCIMTTIDPDTGTVSNGGEPLKTLKTFRQLTDPFHRRKEGEAPMFGVYLGMDVSGMIRIGDPIYATE